MPPLTRAVTVKPTARAPGSVEDKPGEATGPKAIEVRPKPLRYPARSDWAVLGESVSSAASA